MSGGIFSILETWQSRLAAERAVRAMLIECAAPKITGLSFRKQSHNAVVFQGELDGQPVFLKRYQTDYGPTLTRISVEETAIVRAQMDGVTAGIADIIWASEPQALVLMSAAPGTPVADALSGGQVAEVMPHVAHWLNAYIGPRRFGDRFSTSHWIKTRRALDWSTLSEPDQALVAQALDVQQARHAAHGALPALKGRHPKDFAPHNLHWTGTAVWGFDIEGYSKNPIARAIARFCVLAERRVPADAPRRLGVAATCLAAFEDAIDLSADPPELMAFVILDELLQSLFRRHDDPVAGPAIRRAMTSHLSGV